MHACLKKCNIKIDWKQKKLNYRNQIARQLRTQYVDGLW